MGRGMFWAVACVFCWLAGLVVAAPVFRISLLGAAESAFVHITPSCWNEGGCGDLKFEI
jgi:hypothetical protein